MIADMMRRMKEAGAPMEAIMIAVEAIEALQLAEQDRRDKRAAQKRKERGVSDVARQSGDKDATVAATHPPVSSPNDSITLTPSSSPPSSLRSVKSSERDFADFWSVVPRKIGRDAAEKAYRKIVSSGRATTAAILAGVIRWRDEARDDDPQFVPHPATWLNRGGWEDEPRQRPPTRAGPGGGRNGKPTMAEMSRMDEPGFSFDDPRNRQHQPDTTTSSANPGASGFAGRLSLEDHARARRADVVDC